MKITNEAANLKLELDSDTKIDLNKEELLQVIYFNLSEIDAVTKLKIIRTLFETKNEKTKEDLIETTMDMLYYFFI